MARHVEQNGVRPRKSRKRPPEIRTPVVGDHFAHLKVEREGKGRGMSGATPTAGTPGRVQQSPALRALCDGALAHRAALHLVTKEVIALANGALQGEGGPGRGGAPSPRPPLSPSNFNAATSPSPTTPAGGPTRRSKRRPGSVGAAAIVGHGEGGQRPLSATSGASPIAPDVLRSPRDPMNIAHLLSSSRSPWSPRHFGVRGGTAGAAGPPQMTNRFNEGCSLAKPRTRKSPGSGKAFLPSKKALPQSGKRAAADSSAWVRMEPSSQSSYRALHTDLTRAARAEERDEGDYVPMSGDELGADGGDSDVVTAGSVGHLPVQLFVAAIGACVLMVPKP
jgi:hypothetical protein